MHMKALEETPFRMTWTENSQTDLVAKDFTFPMINMGGLHRRKQSNAKKKARKLPGHRRPKTNLEYDFDSSINAAGTGRLTDLKM